MSSSAEEASSPGSQDNPYAIALVDLEAGVNVPWEDQVTEEDTEVPPLPSEAETRRAEVMRVITHGG